MKRFKPYIQMLFTRITKINVDSIPIGTIIDIGGGGEGIIAQIGKERVTAIDKLQSEIDEAKSHASSAQWVLADATDLPYSEGFFDNATAFFSSMYMDMETFGGVCHEVHRVLKPSGEFWIWGATIPNTKELYILRLQITLPNGKMIKTGYGSRKKSQNLKIICDKLSESNFSIKVAQNHGKWFFLKAQKLV